MKNEIIPTKLISSTVVLAPAHRGVKNQEFEKIQTTFNGTTRQGVDWYTVSTYRIGNQHNIQIKHGSESASFTAPKHLFFQQAKWVLLDGHLVLAAAFGDKPIKNSMITGFMIFTNVDDYFLE